MKKRIRNVLAGAAAFFLAGFGQTANASHYQGSDLTYANIAPGVYVVNLKLYRDCSGSSAPTTATLNLKSPGCNNGRVVTMNKIGIQRIGMPYCASIPPTCTSTGRTNFEETTFTATVYFSATEQNCSEWILSWQECCRPSTANLVGQDNFYTEAMVNLTAGINNNSPEFSPLNVPIPFINYNQPIRLSLNAAEVDGDSLVYSLAPSLNGLNTSVPTKSYGANMIFNADSTKSAMAPAGSFSTTFPIYSYTADWSQPMPLTAIPKFTFDSRTGNLGFIPSYYDPASPSAAGTNKYAVAVRIDEWRKINGVPTKVGSIRRDMLVNVIDCGPNQNPLVTSPVVNGQVLGDGDIINLRPGTPMNMQFAVTDGNANDIVNLISDVTSVLPGAVYNKTAANQPTATVSWTPTASHVSNRIYYFQVHVEDNACPVKGFQTYTFGVRVSATGGVTGVNEVASKPRFVAYPNPFAETVSFKLNLTKGADQQLVIYNALGQQVDKIALTGFAAGEQTVVWKKAAKMANGQYVAKLISNKAEVQTIKFSKLQ